MNKCIEISFFVLIFSLFSSCGKHLQINRENIFYTEWRKGHYQGFMIAKIYLTDSVNLNVSKEFLGSQLNKHVVDSSFCFIQSSKIQPHRSKIYFNKSDSNASWIRCNNLYDVRKTIGMLEMNTWYVVDGLGQAIVYYVYVDSFGKSHTYSYGPTNW